MTWSRDSSCPTAAASDRAGHLKIVAARHGMGLRKPARPRANSAVEGSGMKGPNSAYRAVTRCRALIAGRRTIYGQSLGMAIAHTTPITAADWAALGSAAFAAVAAGGAWATVWQTRRTWRDLQTPHLTPSWIEPGNRVRLLFTNSGGGYALQSFFIVVSGPEYSAGVIPPVTLSPGTRVQLETELAPVGALHEVTGVVFCLDRSGTWHVWSWAGEHRTPRKRLRKVRSLSPEQALALFYPSLSADKLIYRGWHHAASP